MKKVLKTKRTFLTLMVLLLALAAMFSGCENIGALLETDTQGTSEITTAGAGTEEDPYANLITPEVTFQFVSNGDGTCAVNGLSFEAADDARVHIDFPATSPDGEKVVEIQNTGMAGYGNIPKMILPEDYEKIDAKLKEKVADGTISNFYYAKLSVFFDKQDLEEQKSQIAKEALLVAYPIVAISPIYTFVSDATPKEIAWVSSYLYRFADYTKEDCMADYTNLLDTAKASALCTDEILNSIAIPDNPLSKNIVSVYIPDGVVKIGEETFTGWPKLKKIQMENSVTDIGASAFYCCDNLIDINISDGVTSIGNSAFQDCISLTTINIPDGVTSIGDSAFSACTSLASITIPNSVTSIDRRAFDGCSSLASINFQGTKAEWLAINWKDSSNYPSGEFTVHCTDGDIPKADS